MFNFDLIEYPAFIVVYGPSKHHISTYNRSEFDEQFACGMAFNAEQAKTYLMGYPGNQENCKVYAVPNPESVCQLYFSGHNSPQYEAEIEYPDPEYNDPNED